eukprot:1367960-Pyramimonas_sp.AAC.1
MESCPSPEEAAWFESRSEADAALVRLALPWDPSQAGALAVRLAPADALRLPRSRLPEYACCGSRLMERKQAAK